MKIAYISTYPPRQCGIATFNQNLVKAISGNFQNQTLEDSSYVIALNNIEGGEELVYPPEVKFVVGQNVNEDYIKAANYINSSDVDACILQHEFGIYAGDNGIFVWPFINRIKVPIISILHTILDDPSFIQKYIIKKIVKVSSKIVVMSKKGVSILTEVYNVPRHKIQIIEHGVPDLEVPENNPVRELPALKGKKILLTFGLISRGKGLETVIKALPAITKEHPEAVYVILGNTHPGILKHSGEEYRDYLKDLAEELNVSDHLVFIKRYVEEAELIQYLGAADIYVTPYPNEAQITSGTLSYAVGAGAAVVSTPYWHAKELLDNNRGAYFGFKDEVGLANVVNDLLSKPDKLKQIKQNAYNYGKQIRWPKIGKAFIKVIKKSIEEAVEHDASVFPIIDRSALPDLSLNYIKRMTDDTGIFQHAKYGIPNRNEGYCIDDNSRALITALMAYKETASIESLEMIPVYMSYIHHMHLENGNFRNFLSFDRRFLDEEGSDDSFGRTIWSLGFLVNNAPNKHYADFGRQLFQDSIQHFSKLTHIRGIANTIIGITYFLRSCPGDERVNSELNNLINKLVASYQSASDSNWHWFENHLTYDNGILPLALYHAAEITEDDQLVTIADEALKHLENLTFTSGTINPVGNNGWYFKDTNKMALYDQQAIDVMAMVLMYYQAFIVTKESKHLETMFNCHLWFLGQNSLQLPIYDSESKGCGDGLQSNGVNKNQGAESTLAYLLSHLTVIKAIEYDQKLIGTMKEKVLMYQ